MPLSLIDRLLDRRARGRRAGLAPKSLVVALLGLGAGQDGGAWAKADPAAARPAVAPTAPATAAPAVTCAGQTDPGKPVAVGSGRKVYCALDLGSKNAKLQVISIRPGDPLSFADQRLCKSPLGLGAKVYDAKTKVKGPLPPADIANLIAVVQTFKQICAVDAGQLVGAEATQWARDASNIAEVKAAVRAGAGLDIDVLSTEEEGQYGYIAATRKQPGRFVLDPGSNSFQLGWQEKRAALPRSVSVDFGYVRASAVHYPGTAAEDYATARGKHAAEVVGKLEAALAAATPASSLAALQAATRAGKIKPEIVLLGQDGALDLAVRAALRGVPGDATKWIDSKDGYEARAHQTSAARGSGAAGSAPSNATSLTPAELQAWFTSIVGPADYEALRSKAVRDLYGEKALANTVLLDTLVRRLGLTSITLVPQEMPIGYILAKLAKHS